MMLSADGAVQVIWGIRNKLNHYSNNMNTTYSRTILCLLSLGLYFNSYAQSYVTYNHDDTKMNQITVQEIGTGGLTPEYYYDIFHNTYQKTAAAKNKLSFRTLVGVSAYQQIEYADSIEASLTKRAEIEALNIADRQIDLAWQVEGSKIEGKLSDFENNINRIASVGGSPNDKERWTEYSKMFRFAIRQTQNSYMPNAQRKKEYLAIYADITKQNETLIAYLVQQNNRKKTEELLSATSNRPNHKSENLTAAYSRWRNSALAKRHSTGSDEENKTEQ